MMESKKRENIQAIQRFQPEREVIKKEDEIQL